MRTAGRRRADGGAGDEGGLERDDLARPEPEIAPARPVPADRARRRARRARRWSRRRPARAGRCAGWCWPGCCRSPRRPGAGWPAPGGRRGCRPRWAMPTSESTKSGSSAASVANSSITTTRRGSGSRGSPACAVVGQVAGAGVAQQPLPVAQLGLEAAQRPLGRGARRGR